MVLPGVVLGGIRRRPQALPQVASVVDAGVSRDQEAMVRFLRTWRVWFDTFPTQDAQGIVFGGGIGQYVEAYDVADVLHRIEAHMRASNQSESLIECRLFNVSTIQCVCGAEVIR